MKKKEKMAFGRLDLMRNDLFPPKKKIRLASLASYLPKIDK